MENISTVTSVHKNYPLESFVFYTLKNIDIFDRIVNNKIKGYCLDADKLILLRFFVSLSLKSPTLKSQHTDLSNLLNCFLLDVSLALSLHRQITIIVTVGVPNATQKVAMTMSCSIPRPVVMIGKTTIY